MCGAWFCAVLPDLSFRVLSLKINFCRSDIDSLSIPRKVKSQAEAADCETETDECGISFENLREQIEQLG